MFLDTVAYLRNIDALPVILRFSTEETAENIARHNAGWHKSCRNKFSKSKMQRNMFIASYRIRKLPKVEDERRLCKRKCLNAEKCIFCEQEHEIEQLSSVQTFEQDSNIRTMATDLQDVEIMARISGGDLIAIEAKYHLSFLTKLRNRHRSFQRKLKHQTMKKGDNVAKYHAFEELLQFIEDCVMEGVFLFKIKDLHSLYTKRLADLGIEKCINKTVLKQSILDHFKTAHSQYDGKGTIIVFSEGMQAMLKNAIQNRHCAKDAHILRQAANIVRKDILDHSGFRFSGKFSKQCQEKSLPMSAQSLVAMICNGTNIKHQSECNTQVCLTTCQILVLNTKKTTTNLDTF